MIIALVVVGCIAAYFLIGFRYARSQVHRCVQRAEKVSNHADTRRESVNMQMAWRVVLWPVAMVYDAAGAPIREWMWRPETERIERLERLREDRRAWAGRRHEGSADEQRMAADIVAALDDILTRESSVGGQ